MNSDEKVAVGRERNGREGESIEETERIFTEKRRTR